MAAPEIRPARPEDRGGIEALIEAAYGRYVPLIGRPGPMLDDYGALIAAGRVHVLDEDGALRGVLVLIEEPEGMLLDNVAVSPEAQGRGFGRRLIAHAEEAARKAGHPRIRLYTNEVMTENITLYSSIGYRETHRAVEKGFSRVYMEKRFES